MIGQKCDLQQHHLDKHGVAVSLANTCHLSTLKTNLGALRKSQFNVSSGVQVRERDLPPAQNNNDLRISGGICHGKFAWFLRTCPEVCCCHGFKFSGNYIDLYI